MTGTQVMSRDDLERRMTEASVKQDAALQSGGSKTETMKLKPGLHALRILPNKGYPENMQWIAKYGYHFFKHAGKNGVMFACDYHSNSTPCPICKTAWDLRDKAKAEGNTDLEKFSMSVKGQQKLLMNVIDLNDQAKGVQLLQASKTFYDFLRQFQDMVNKLMVDPTYGSALMIQVTEKSNGFGYDYKVTQHQPYDVSAQVTDDNLYDLEEAKRGIVENMVQVSDFTGDLYKPLPDGHARLGGNQTGQAQPAGNTQQGFPGAQPATPASAPSSSPFGGGQTVDATYTTEPAQPQQAQQPQQPAAQAAPASAPEQPAQPQQPAQSSPFGGGQPAQNGQATNGAAPASPFGAGHQAQAQPAQAQQPAQAEPNAEELEAKLLAMVS